ncbi:16400_t:CDS:10 [Acaulospora colombiana]|uniref:16400_t:CDS:1 n=1 Tax=Acaulospora colombiana TaxID=27376 RepID=A0ACA9KSV8_9GLOM|nr:16400_t:CDS:10 [Acaulospora colombiana]
MTAQAFILTLGDKHYKTTDKGESWIEFTTPIPPAIKSGTYYTDDNFSNPPKLLLKYTDKCIWARSTKESQDAPTSTVFCIRYNPSTDGSMRKWTDYSLVVSENYFASSSIVNFNGTDPVAALGIGATQEYLIAAVKNVRTYDLEMFVSKGGQDWRRAIFPLDAKFEEKEKENAYTILESAPYHLVIDVLSSKTSTGKLFISNSDGEYFVDSLNHTNRNIQGNVDFEKVQSVNGILIANVVDNWHEVDDGSAIAKRIRSKISFEDGKISSWKYIRPPDKNFGGSNFYCSVTNWESGDCSLHLHSITTASNYGFIYSSSAAPGFLMGVGNVGSYLFPYEQCDTFLSTDGGLTWKVARLGPHKYEFGDMGSLIVAVDDKTPTDKIWYSSDYGENWEEFSLGISFQIRAKMLTADPESASQSFILIGSILSNQDSLHRYFIFKISFKDLHDRQCTDNDFEQWQARKIDGKQCVEVVKGYVPPGKCRKEGDKYWASSGYRLVPGNKCDRDAPNAKRKDEPVEKECTKDHIAPGDITSSISYYNFDTLSYFTNSTVVLSRDVNGNIYRSVDDGTSWKLILNRIVYLILHEHDSTRAFAFTEDNKLLYTSDRGGQFTEINIPLGPNTFGRPILDFHPDNVDWLLFLGSTSCPGCHTESYFSRDNGATWTLVETWAEKCIFGRDTDFSKPDETTIFCSSYKDKNYAGGQESLGGKSTEANPLRLISTKDFGKTKEVKLSDLVEYFVFNKYMAVATEKNGQLCLFVSVNGTNFNEAKFPPDVKIDKKAYTLLQSNTGSIFLDAYQSFEYNAEYGSLFKSNGDGTFFSLSLENTNRNGYGNVDFEKVRGMDGIILANVVSNTLELKKGVSKKIVTMISFDDGSTWERLKINSNLNGYLNLHGRTDIRRSGGVFSKSSAVGLLIGVGNEGEYLEPYEQSKTYMSRDAGRTWTQIRSGESLYEFGDQGTILAVVDDEGPTNKLKYSWDYGAHWNEYVFYQGSVRLSYIISNPKATSMKFILTGLEISSEVKPVVVNIDFTQLEKRTCQPDDFELWNPMHDTPNKCFLGREVDYWRRKADRECKIGDSTSSMKPNERICACTERDFECDYNYFREDGKCKSFVQDPDRPHNCSKTYLGRSGYRKISESKCVGGIDLSQKVEKSCELTRDDIIVKTVTVYYVRELYVCGKEKNILVIRTESNQIWRSNDQGYSWTAIPELADVKIVAMLQNPYFSNFTYFITLGTTHYYTHNAAQDIMKMDVPLGPNLLELPILDYHPERPDWLIYTASEGCDRIFSDCHSVVYYTKDGGKSWNQMDTYVNKCTWARDKKFRVDENLIFCESYREKKGSQRSFYNNPLRFCTSKDFFSNKVDCKFENIVGFATFEEYMVVAELSSSGQSLNLMVSMDGETFANAQFPPNMQLTRSAFTILESTTHAIMLHVTTSTRGLWGNILKSNSNGTYYSLSLEYSYQDARGFVDFEKIRGIQGIAMANRVTNPQEVNMGGSKKISSVITFNDGSTWRPLKRPEFDSDGRPYNCDDVARYSSELGLISAQIFKCSLHLHSYTERRDPRDAFSSSSAVGLIMGVGNVGQYLTSYSDGDTFLTRDAGMTWKEVRKGAYMYEFGDQGSILVMVDDEKPTDHILQVFLRQYPHCCSLMEMLAKIFYLNPQDILSTRAYRGQKNNSPYPPSSSKFTTSQPCLVESAADLF